MAESIQRSASDRLGDLVPSQVRARTLQLQAFSVNGASMGPLSRKFLSIAAASLRWTFLNAHIHANLAKGTKPYASTYRYQAQHER